MLKSEDDAKGLFVIINISGAIDGYQSILIYLESIDARIVVLTNTLYLFPGRTETLKKRYC